MLGTLLTSWPCMSLAALHKGEPVAPLRRGTKEHMTDTETTNNNPRVTDAMVSRFLAWPLPEDFAPDGGITFARNNEFFMPIGTNLLHAGQVRAMLEHVLADEVTTPKTGSIPLSSAVDIVCAGLRDDLDYAWSWHCNIAMAAVDAGCPHDVANEGAARFMEMLGGVDTRKHVGFAQTQVKSGEQCEAEIVTKNHPDGTTGAAPLPDVSPTTSATIEAEIQAKGLTAPRVTPADIEANIVSEHYFTAGDGVIGNPESPIDASEETFRSLDLLTFCVLVLRNGFTVTGESACASPENFDTDTGRKIARENAVQKLWPLMGYALKQKLSEAK